MAQRDHGIVRVSTSNWNVKIYKMLGFLKAKVLGIH